MAKSKDAFPIQQGRRMLCVVCDISGDIPAFKVIDDHGQLVGDIADIAIDNILAAEPHATVTLVCDVIVLGAEKYAGLIKGDSVHVSVMGRYVEMWIGDRYGKTRERLV